MLKMPRTIFFRQGEMKGFAAYKCWGTYDMGPRLVATQSLWTLISCQRRPGCVKTAVAACG